MQNDTTAFNETWQDLDTPFLNLASNLNHRVCDIISQCLHYWCVYSKSWNQGILRVPQYCYSFFKNVWLNKREKKFDFYKSLYFHINFRTNLSISTKQNKTKKPHTFGTIFNLYIILGKNNILTILILPF